MGVCFSNGFRTDHRGFHIGIVSDPTGAVVPGAKIVLTDNNKGYTYNAVTDSVGRYVLLDLPASNYKLTVEASGFKSTTQEGIILEVAAKLAIDVKLQIGATTQSVEVLGAAPVLHTEDAVTGQEVDREPRSMTFRSSIAASSTWRSWRPASFRCRVPPMAPAPA